MAPKPDPAAERQARLDAWLSKGQQALQQDRLATPENDNAVYYFRSAEAEAPGNAAAAKGLDDVFNRYLELARNAHNSNDFGQALALVDAAEKVHPANSLSQAMRKQILEEQARVAARAKKTALRQRVDYKLELAPLTARDDRIVQRLRSIAEHVRTVKGAIRIDARSDAEARWIHDQLKQAEPGYNFHAELHRSQVPKIVLWMPET